MSFLHPKKKTVANKDLSFEGSHSKLSDELQKQDEQIKRIAEAEEQYKNDVDSLIRFWEEIWENGGLLFNGSAKTFRLPDLYIKEKRYDDALKILKKINNPAYKDKKEAYIQKIMAKKKTAKAAK